MINPITAKDVYEKMNSFDPEIDEFIKTTILPRFCSECKTTIELPDNLVKRFFTIDEFKRQMEMRGFVVVYECEDRRYYEITIPPQGE